MSQSADLSKLPNVEKSEKKYVAAPPAKGFPQKATKKLRNRKGGPYRTLDGKRV